MQTITVDMTPGFRQPTIHYSQNDVGTTFAIDLRSRFGDTLPASPTVKIQATKPSGFGFSIEADSVVDSVATFTTVATMTDEAGRFLAELEVSDSGVVLYTANFYMEGEANPHPIGTTDGQQETVIPTLTLLVERVEAAAASVLDMEVNATTLAAGSQATYSYDEDTNTATFGIPQGEAGAGAAGVTASAYSSSKTYAVGDYVIHNSNLYRCTTAITTAEAFTAAHWTQVVLGDDVCDLKSDFNDITNSLYKMKYVRDVTNGTTNWVKYVGNIYLCVFVPANVECSFLSQRITYYTMLDSDDFTVGTAIDYSDGYSSFVQVQANSLNGIASANTDRYLTIMTHDGTYNRTPVNIIVNGINILESVIDTFVDIDNALKTIDNTVTLSTTGADSVIKKYEFKSGKKYLAVNSSSSSVSVNLRTRATPSGSNIENIATTLVGGSVAEFTCSQNASYVYMYANGASNVSIIDISTLQYRVQALEAQNNEFVISASGDGDYTTLRAGISEAIKYPNAKVFVADGVYDLCAEFAAEISGSVATQYGICLENDVHVVFSSGAKVKALYAGNDSNVETYFAPFYVGVNGGGFTLENLDIEASNTRYCVHEEYNGADLSVRCKYINCRMSMDNTSAPLGYYPQCIGAGVAKHTYSEIVGCYFKSKYAESHDNTPLVSYHNTSYTNEALSEIFVSNSYFADKGTFRCTWHGTSPDMSRSFVNNCSFGSAPYCQANGSSSTTVNMELVEFNNVVRS